MEEGKRKIEKKSDYCKNNPNFCMLHVLSFSQPIGLIVFRVQHYCNFLIKN